MSLLDDIELYASHLWDTWAPETIESKLVPRMDMYEEKDTVVMKMELPGMKKEDLDISYKDGCLTMKAEKKQEETKKGTTYYCSERCYGTYSRSTCLPYPVDAEKITATFEGGVLEIRLPKAEEAKARQIEIKVK
jgi:HSP20 family protein